MGKRALLLLSLALPAWAAFEASHWRWRRPFSSAAAGPARLRLDPEVLAHARADLADLRVQGPGGWEVPYALESGRPKAAAPRPARIHDLSRTPAGDTVFELDLGEAPEPHDAVTLELARGSDYRKAARVEASDDGRAWRTVLENGLLLDYERPVRVRHGELAYPESRRRRLRVTIFEGGAEPARVLGATVRRRALEAEEEVLPAAGDGAGEEDGLSAWEFDLGADLPAAKARLATDEKGFKRRVVVSSFDEEAKRWDKAADGAIYRYRSGATEASSLEVSFPERRARRWRVELYHYDDRPLAVSRVSLVGFVRRLRLKDAAPGRYELHYGNPRAKAPRYDLTSLGERPEGGPELRLGPAAENPDYAPEPGPWSEEHPALLGVALVAAVVLLGSLIARQWKNA